MNQARKEGGLGPLKIPIVSDLTHSISKDYGVYLEEMGHTLRYMIIQIIQQLFLSRFCFCFTEDYL